MSAVYNDSDWSLMVALLMTNPIRKFVRLHLRVDGRRYGPLDLW